MDCFNPNRSTICPQENKIDNENPNISKLHIVVAAVTTRSRKGAALVDKLDTR